MDTREISEKMAKVKWFKKELLWYDVMYNVIGFNTRIHHPDLINNLPRFGTEFKILDIRTGKMYDAYMNIKQFQISSLKPLYDVYPSIEIENVIRIAINPEKKDEIWVDFKYQEEIEKITKKEADKRIREEENRKLKRFKEYKKTLKEYDLQRKYDIFKTMLKEKAVEDLKKTREEINNIRIDNEEYIEQGKKRSIEDFEQRHIQMIENAEKCVKQMIENTEKCVKQMIENAEKCVKQMIEDTKPMISMQHSIGNEKIDDIIKNLTEAERLRKLAEDDKEKSIKNLTETERLRKLAEDDKEKSVKNLTEAERLRKLTEDDKTDIAAERIALKKIKEDIERVQLDNERILKLIDDDLQQQMKLARIYREGMGDKVLRGKMVIVPGIYGDETVKLFANKIGTVGIETFIKDVEIRERKDIIHK